MMVSSRGRYALRVMADLAENEKNGAFIPLKEIAEREELSLKYLESIMTTLSKAGLVEGAHGKGGGYRLKRKPEEYRVSEILKLTEGSLPSRASRAAAIHARMPARAAPARCGRSSINSSTIFSTA